MTKKLSQSHDVEDGMAAAVLTACMLGGFIGLGYIGEKCYAWSKILRRVEEMSPAAFTARKLKALFGARWCSENYTVYPEEGEPYFDHQALADDIQEECQAKGRYQAVRERGAGAWLDKDGNLVVNSVEVWRDDGTQVPRDGSNGYVYPEDAGIDLESSDEPATPAEMCEVERSVSSWLWDNLAATALIIGWVVVSTFCGALTARPHLWITAAAGTGKSLLSRLIGALFGTAVARPVGSVTKASILQELKSRAIPCIIDETEAGLTGRQSVMAALDVARWSYSMSEHEDGVLRGTASGKVLSYRAFSPFLFLGINPPKLGHADQTRTVVLEMKQPERGSVRSLPRLLLDEGYARAVGRKLRRLAVARFPVFVRVLPLFRQAIISRGGATRTADTLGTLLAGYWCVKSIADPTPADLDTLVACLDLEAQIEAHDESDELRCADVLYYSKVVVPVAESHGEMTRTITVAAAVRLYCAAPERQHRLGEALQNYGVRLMNEKGQWKVAVCSSDSHKELLRVFAGSSWTKGGWGQMLRRLPGGARSTKRVAGRTCKVSMFDVLGDLLPTAGSEGMEPDDGGTGPGEMRLAA